MDYVYTLILVCIVLLYIYYYVTTNRRYVSVYGTISLIHKNSTKFDRLKVYCGFENTYSGCFISRSNYYSKHFNKSDFVYFTIKEKKYIDLKESIDDRTQMIILYRKKFLSKSVSVYDVIL